jgi:hypothetical protein
VFPKISAKHAHKEKPQGWNVPDEKLFYVSAAALPLVVLSIPGCPNASGHKVANNKDCYRAEFWGPGQTWKAAWDRLIPERRSPLRRIGSGELIGRVTCRRLQLQSLEFARLGSAVTDPGIGARSVNTRPGQRPFKTETFKPRQTEHRMRAR